MTMVKDIAPHITRQRLLVEGYYTIEMTRQVVEGYLRGIADHLNVQTYGQPIVFSPGEGTGKAENQGFDGFLPLIDSGIAVYVWTHSRFFSVLLYTCKTFDESKALSYTRRYFDMDGEIVYLSF